MSKAISSIVQIQGKLFVITSISVQIFVLEITARTSTCAYSEKKDALEV